MSLNFVDYQVDLTYYCNLNCVYCIQKSHGLRNKKCFDLNNTVSTIEKIINDNPELKSLKIEFFGGEPTLEKTNMLKIIDLYKDYDFVEFEITTNCVIDVEDIILYLKKHNKKLKLSCSFDSIFNKDNRCNGLANLNKRIEKNIIKYKKISEEWNNCVISICCCVREKNAGEVNEIVDYINKTFGKINICLSPVFGEFWKNESFNKFNKGLKKISKQILKDGLYELPTLMMSCKKFFFYKNPYFEISKKAKTELDKIYYNGFEEKRFKNKKTFLVYEIPNYEIEYNNEISQLNTLKEKASSHHVFNQMVSYLLMHGIKKRFKKELFCLFNFSVVYQKQFEYIIKRIINSDINLKGFFKAIDKDFNHDLILKKINKNYILLNDKIIKIKETNNNYSFFSTVTNSICLTKHNDIQETNFEIIHELCHYIFNNFNIKFRKEDEEYYCETLVDFIYKERVKKGMVMFN